MKDNYSVVPIEEEWEKLEVVHLDQLIQMCGMYEEDRCLAPQNTESPGYCHGFSCPVAVRLDSDDPRWTEDCDDEDWMIAHSEFKKKEEILETAMGLWEKMRPEVYD